MLAQLEPPVTLSSITPYRTITTVYSLTVTEIHAYYMFAGDTPVLVLS